MATIYLECFIEIFQISLLPDLRIGEVGAGLKITARYFYDQENNHKYPYVLLIQYIYYSYN